MYYVLTAFCNQTVMWVSSPFLFLSLSLSFSSHPTAPLSYHDIPGRLADFILDSVYKTTEYVTAFCAHYTLYIQSLVLTLLHRLSALVQNRVQIYIWMDGFIYASAR